MMRQWILSTCLVLSIARFVAADTGYNLRREIAWARLKWSSDLEGVRFGSPTKTLLAWVPAEASIDAWAFSPSHECDRIELRRISGTPAEFYGHDLLVGRSIVENDVRAGREVRAWRSFAFGDLFSEGGEALSLEEHDADGKWQPAGETGTIGRELATYGVLSYADATVARFGAGSSLDFVSQICNFFRRAGRADKETPHVGICVQQAIGRLRSPRRIIRPGRTRRSEGRVAQVM